MRPSATWGRFGPATASFNEPRFVVFAKGVSTGTSSAAMTFLHGHVTMLRLLSDVCTSVNVLRAS